MPIITHRQDVLGIYQEAREKHWVLPCFCTENLTTTEAILEATREYGASLGIVDLPIIIAITNQYHDRSQSIFYTHTRRWDIGLKLFMADLRVLAEPGSPYEKLRIMIHLDHTQFDDDQDLLNWDMREFSSIMYDASRAPFAENIRLTRAFVEQHGDEIVIEGACDEIADESGRITSVLTSAQKAQDYLDGTGADLIVANLGTEHRAVGMDKKYHGDYAQAIQARIGTRLVLHGASSVPGDQLAGLIDDGVCKVNLWTMLERDSSPVLFKEMVMHASQVAGNQLIQALKAENYLGDSVDSESKASIDYFTTTYRQTVVFDVMKSIVYAHLRIWYR
ncbi:MAG: class II fructose-bisphosphate aldolase [Eubacteriales bacterium]|nr:class II fructose-bisphosphate aldolase [Eubacteriales bacterium]